MYIEALLRFDFWHCEGSHSGSPFFCAKRERLSGSHDLNRSTFKLAGYVPCKLVLDRCDLVSVTVDNTVAIPEPGTLGLLLCGFSALGTS
jgi:hypothetical protein